MDQEDGQRPESPESSPSSWNPDNSSPIQEFPPQLGTGKKYLYIIREQQDSYNYNIGITDDDPETKRQQLQVGNSRPLILKKTFKGNDEDVEKKKNALLKEIEQKKIGKKTGGEGTNWFNVPVYKMKILKAVVDENVPDTYEKPENGKWLYIVREQEVFSNHKIGVSKNPKGRSRGLKTGNGRCLIFKRFFEGNRKNAFKAERALHEEIKDEIGVKMGGGGREWFQVPANKRKRLYALMSSKASENNLVKVVKNVIYPTV